jgi:hypothetical protein
MNRSRPARLALPWPNLPQANHLHVVHTLGQILIRQLLNADGPEVEHEDS